MNDNRFGTLRTKDFLSVTDLDPAEVDAVFRAAGELKRNRDVHTELLKGRRLAMLFEKDSLRTRVTFEVGMQDLGGSAVVLDLRGVRLGQREAVSDVARNLERWVHGIVARTYSHAALQELADTCDVPVINALSDWTHPCQALADLFTLSEKWGRIQGRRICYVGDGNNVSHSLLQACAMTGMRVAVCTPDRYRPDPAVVGSAQAMARATGGAVELFTDPFEAVVDADAVYTDVWASMGQESERSARAEAFRGYQVNTELMARAKPGALFLHCLPAHRGEEVTTEVLEGPTSIVFDCAENRLHVQKALLVMLMGARR